MSFQQWLSERIAYALLPLTLLAIVGAVVIGKVQPAEPVMVAWLPDTYVTDTVYLTRIGTRVRTQFALPYQSVPAETDGYLHVPTDDACRIAYIERNPTDHDDITVRLYNAYDDSWRLFPLQLQHTTRERARFLQGKWSPDGRWFSYFHTYREYLLDLQTQQHYLPPQRGFQQPNSHWSPDSRYYVYPAYSPRGLHLFDTQTQQFTRTEIAGSQIVGWSPDSRRLVLLRNTGDNRMALALFNPQTRTLRDITPPMGIISNGFGDVSMLQWSPDGTQILFVGMSGRLDTSQRVQVQTYLLDLATETMTALPDSTVRWRSGWRPTWSPDGQRVTYAMEHPANPTTPTLAMLDATMLQRLTMPLIPLRTVTRANQQWSPDSRYLLLTNTDQQLLALDTSQATVQVIDDFPRQLLGWLPDGRTLAYTTQEAGILYLAHVSAAQVTQWQHPLHARRILNVALCQPPHNK